jgi:hypothetical protein
MEWQKNHEKLSFAISKLSSQLMLIIKTVKMALKQKSFGNVLEQSILKKELQPFREKKSSIYGRIIKSFQKINTNLKAG